MQEVLEKLAALASFTGLSHSHNTITFYNTRSNSYCQLEVVGDIVHIYADAILDASMYFVMPKKAFISQDLSPEDLYLVFDHLYSVTVIAAYRF
jgi:hypothetical protein